MSEDREVEVSEEGAAAVPPAGEAEESRKIEVRNGEAEGEAASAAAGEGDDPSETTGDGEGADPPAEAAPADDDAPPGGVSEEDVAALEADLVEAATSDADDAAGDVDELSLLEAVEAQVEALKAENAALQAEMESKDATLRESEEARMRLRADFDNYRKRQQREVARLSDEKAEGMLLKVIPVYDSVGRAVAQFDKDDCAKSLAEGLEMIRQQFEAFLQTQGVTKIEAEGKPFDPNLHEALVRVPIPEGMQEDDVAEVFEDGYLIGEKVLRPSKVSVAKEEA